MRGRKRRKTDKYANRGGEVKAGYDFDCAPKHEDDCNSCISRHCENCTLLKKTLQEPWARIMFADAVRRILGCPLISDN